MEEDLSLRMSRLRMLDISKSEGKDVPARKIDPKRNSNRKPLFSVAASTALLLRKTNRLPIYVHPYLWTTAHLMTLGIERFETLSDITNSTRTKPSPSPTILDDWGLPLGSGYAMILALGHIFDYHGKKRTLGIEILTHIGGYLDGRSDSSAIFAPGMVKVPGKWSLRTGLQSSVKLRYDKDLVDLALPRIYNLVGETAGLSRGAPPPVLAIFDERAHQEEREAFEAQRIYKWRTPKNRVDSGSSVERGPSWPRNYNRVYRVKRIQDLLAGRLQGHIPSKLEDLNPAYVSYLLAMVQAQRRAYQSPEFYSAALVIAYTYKSHVSFAIISGRFSREYIDGFTRPFSRKWAASRTMEEQVQLTLRHVQILEEAVELNDMVVQKVEKLLRHIEQAVRGIIEDLDLPKV